MLPTLALVTILAVLPVTPATLTGAVPDAPAPAAALAMKPVPPGSIPWLGRVSSGLPGPFAPPRSFAASYRVTWSDIEAARIDARCSSPEHGSQIRTFVQANTTGAARLLYQFDATHLSIVNRRTLRPVRLEQTEEESRKHIFARVDFSANGAVRWGRDLTKDAHDDPGAATPRLFNYPGLFDLQGAFLYLRSLPLADGDEKSVALMTSGNPYLITVKVLGRGMARVGAGEFRAIECSLGLEKINKTGGLEPRKGFKSAHVWISDDADRLLLKVESEVFIGSVELELEKVTFPGAPPPPAR